MDDIALWKARNLIKKFSSLHALQGTSVITLILPETEQIPKINSLLTEEFGTASNIKSRVNRLAVLSAITSLQSKLKLYKNIPPNGIILLSGTVEWGGKEKKICVDIPSPKPITKFVYFCDSIFHLESVEELLNERDKTIGYIIIDGNSCLLATLAGNNKHILYKFEVNLPKKHGRGGQSKLRFERLAEEARHNYVGKVCELLPRYFITNEKPNIQMLIIAGSASFKEKLYDSAHFDPRLKSIPSHIISISYDGEMGLNEAISKTLPLINDLKYAEEQKLLAIFFDYIAIDVDKYFYGLKQTLYCLENGLIDILLVSEECDLQLDPKELDSSLLEDENYIMGDKIPILDYLIPATKAKNTKLHIISSNTPQGSQFLKGFSGIGGILRYETKLDFEEPMVEEVEDDDVFW